MLIDTQRRKTKAARTMPDQSEEMKPAKMRFTYAQKTFIKRLLIFIICVYIMFKLYQYTMSVPLPEEERPSHLVPHSEWRYKNNPQGTTPYSLQKMIMDIRNGNPVGWRRDQNLLPPPRADLPLLSRSYRSNGGLTFSDGSFYLAGSKFRILSGAMHYFRVMPQYWENYMRKMKACGLNTLETYVSWNLHEDKPGQFNFQGILDIRKFIQTAKRVGLFVLLRPGPYICSEWDFGGMPAWLLRDPHMAVRSDYPGYKAAVERYFSNLIPEVRDLQYRNGGPIIGVQIENEYGSYTDDASHLKYIKDLLIQGGIEELLFTSDGATAGTILQFAEEALPTTNFKDFSHGAPNMATIRALDKDFPLVVMEFWTGWFDHWEKSHSPASAREMATNLQQILETGASVNFYMFHGGTNFGFMAGANWFHNSNYKPDVTSYDYVAPLSEAGDITPKYELIRELIQFYEPSVKELPDLPADSIKAAYGEVSIDHYMPLQDLIMPVKAQFLKKPVPMEMLNLGKDYGQNYGFTLYRAFIHRGTRISFSLPVQDRVQVLLNGVQIGLLTWHSKFWTVDIPQYKLADDNILDIMVEHQGRVNYVRKGYNKFNEERKGIVGEVLLDQVPIQNWEVYPLEFTESYINSVLESSRWKLFAHWEGVTALYKGTLTIKATPRDTFLNMKKWNKGVVFINGFNLGRYWTVGPQQTLYVPAPVLKPGANSVVIFELHKGSHSVTFQDVHELSPTK